jgi:lipid-A-disaccharide synthase-like uncharacterized protein
MKAGLAWIAGVLFFLRLSIAYSATPSDAQKAVGYVFIAWYCGFFGGCIFAAAYFLGQFRRSHAVSSGVLTAFFSVAAILMLVCHPS